METLLQTALVGTARAGDSAAGTGLPVDDLVGNQGHHDAERRLLLAAGAGALYLQAGRRPESGVQPPEPAPEESRPPCPRLAAAIVGAMFMGEYREILPEACALIDAAGLRLPPDLLHAALSMGAAWRPALRPVLGERGRWLARFNPAWKWALAEAAAAPSGPKALPPEAERIWEEGSPEERREILKRAREVDPDLGRRWLAPAFNKERVDERVALLASLESGLGPEDEPFLEKALDDRSPQVRAAAGLLLARLPGSASATRMLARADALLSLEAKKRRARLRVDPPGEIDASWERDGIPVAAPKGAGKRALWLARTLMRVPPSHWTERFGLAPAGLIAAARGNDWLGPLTEGWARAAILFQDGEWAAALWDLGREGREKDAPSELQPLLPELMEAMPEPEREVRIEGLLAHPPAEEWQLEQYLRRLPMPWKPDFAARYLRVARAAAEAVAGGREPGSAPWPPTFPLAGLALPPASFDDALAAWPLEKAESPDWFQRPWIEGILVLKERVRIRQFLRKEIAP